MIVSRLYQLIGLTRDPAVAAYADHKRVFFTVNNKARTAVVAVM